MDTTSMTSEELRQVDAALTGRFRPKERLVEAIDGYREVSQARFYEVIGPQNVHPSKDNPDVTIWEVYPRRCIGLSFPGWKLSGDPRYEKQYFLPTESE